MPTSTFTFFQDFAEQLGKGVHNFASHSFKIALTNSAPNVSSDAVIGDITEISATGGYTAGGYALDGVTWTESGGVGKLTVTDEVITASGGSVGPFRYGAVQNSSASGALIGYVDYGSSLTLADTESLTVDFDASTGLLTVTV